MKGDAMITSKSNPTYELAGGAAQPASRSGDGRGQATEPNGAAIAGQQWEDDGGPVQVRHPIRPLELATKGTWSVLSLRDLHRAIGLAHWPDNAADVRRAVANDGPRRRSERVV
jgi:hypothetical protein